MGFTSCRRLLPSLSCSRVSRVVSLSGGDGRRVNRSQGCSGSRPITVVNLNDKNYRLAIADGKSHNQAPGDRSFSPRVQEAVRI
jgi:hypothetical protein